MWTFIKETFFVLVDVDFSEFQRKQRWFLGVK